MIYQYKIVLILGISCRLYRSDDFIYDVVRANHNLKSHQTKI